MLLPETIYGGPGLRTVEAVRVVLFPGNGRPGPGLDSIYIDYAGPFEGHMFLVVGDAHSKWIELCKTSSSSAAEQYRS